ncbi:ATP-binding protein [Sulfurimonas sp.]|uniref:ATP-binding protein n=1 Tax=Sulfurimonas sp. TaxID=2022749 RepID=UPI0025DD1630|nr:ATP-binding protein [Sulfurimonas sp.]
MQNHNMDDLLKNFCITQEDILSLQELKDRLPILSNILIDKFYNEYLKDKKDLVYYFRYTDLDQLLNTFKEFIVFIYSSPFDQNYIERVCKVGYVHSSLKLESAKVKYGFFGISQLLSRMSGIDPLVNKNFALLSKILALVEYLVVDSSYYKTNISENNVSQNSSIWMLDKVYSVFSIHKENYSKIETFMKSDKRDLSELNSITTDSSECKFHKLLESFDTQSELLNASGIDIKELTRLHVKWHSLVTEFKSFKEDELKQKELFEKLTLTTNELYEFMDRPLKEFSTSGFLSLNAGLKAISSINNVFSQHDLILSSEVNISANVIQSIKESLQSTLAWAIEDIKIDTKEFDLEEFDLKKIIKYRKFNFYIGLSLKSLANKLYLKEILILLLEALELNFSIKERELSLMGYVDKAESANHAKDVFLSSMSHELRTPLTAVNGYSEVLMLRPDTPDNIREYIKKINIAGNNLLELVNTILDFAKLEAGKMKFNPTLSSVYLILKEVETLSTPMALKKNISLKVVLDLHLYLLLDARLFKQAILNLISNAIKFTPENGKISLTISYEEKRKEYVFSICDTGIGISKEDQGKLFQSFVQIENVYQKSTSGTGLGLMLCKKIIEGLHKGRIWVDSEPDKGSCFHVSIPTPNPIINSYSVTNAPKDAKHLLIVEDSRKFRELLQTYLQDKFKLTFTETNNGAKNLLIAKKFDMIILDFYLTDGISSEVLNYMDEEDINIPIIVMSSEDDLNVAHTIYGNNNLEGIINKRDIKEFCQVLNPNLQ